MPSIGVGFIDVGHGIPGTQLNLHGVLPLPIWTPLKLPLQVHTKRSSRLRPCKVGRPTSMPSCDGTWHVPVPAPGGL